MKPAWTPRALLFDLDGTLIETAPEIADALNATLDALSLPAVDEAVSRGWIGDGAKALLARALAHLGASDVLLATAWPLFRDAYFARLGTRSTLHAGVAEALAGARRRGIGLAVLTNKEGRFANRLLEHHGIAPLFDSVIAGDTLAVKKPDPAVVHHALGLLGAAAHEAAFVGDSVTDVRTARAAGVRAWVVRGGYPGGAFDGADEPDRFVESFAGLLIDAP